MGYLKVWGLCVLYQKEIWVIPVFYPYSFYHACFSIPLANGFHISSHTHPICTTIICVPFSWLYGVNWFSFSSGKGIINWGVGMLCPSVSPQSELELFLLAPGSDKSRVEIHFRCNREKLVFLHRICPAQHGALGGLFSTSHTWNNPVELLAQLLIFLCITNIPEEMF